MGIFQTSGENFGHWMISADAIAVGSLPGERLWGSQVEVELKAAHQVMSQHAELEPGAVGGVVIGRNRIEGTLF